METLKIRTYLHGRTGPVSPERHPQNGAEANKQLHNAGKISDEHVSSRLDL